MVYNVSIFGFFDSNQTVRFNKSEFIIDFKNYSIDINFKTKSHKKRKIADKIKAKIIENFKSENAIEFLRPAIEAWSKLIPFGLEILFQCTSEDEFKSSFTNPPEEKPKHKKKHKHHHKKHNHYKRHKKHHHHHHHHHGHKKY